MERRSTASAPFEVRYPGASLLANFDLDANGLVSLAEFGKLFGCAIGGGA